MTYEIRPCRADEVGQILKLLDRCGLVYAPCDNETNISNKIKSDPQSILVSLHLSSVIGVIFLIRDPWASLTYHLCVHEDYRRRGVARALLIAAEEYIGEISNNVGGYAIETNNAVLKLKKSLGYSIYPQRLILTNKTLEKERRR